MQRPTLTDHEPSGPRVRGIREHLERSIWFLRLSRDSTDDVARYRFALAGIYSARAIIEIMLEAAERQELPTYAGPDPRQSRKSLEDNLLADLPFCHLIEKIRIHDFHRFGCVPPTPAVHELFLGGTVQLRTQKGAASITVSEFGPRSLLSGKSQIREQRPLWQDDGRFFDETTGQYFALPEILGQFLNGVPPVLARFEQLIAT